MSRVIHTGQVIVDVVMRVAALPARGTDVFADSTAFEVGGGFNVLAAARRDGAEVIYTGGHGTGAMGDLVRSALDREGVATLAPRSAEQDTGFCVALVDAGAERTFVSTLGAEGDPSAGALSEAAPQPGDVVYVSGYSLHHAATARALTEWIPGLADGIRVVFDASPMIGTLDGGAIDAIRGRVDILTLNATEARTLLGRIDGSVPQLPLPDVAARLSATWPGMVVVRDGADGCWWADGGDRSHVPAHPVEAVDTNGAGDAHTGVVCAALTRRRPLAEALARANVAAALAVTRSGPATSPTAAEIDAAIGARS